MRKPSGFSYIEVLVSLFILTSGILGAVAMQTTAKKGSFDAMQRSVASALAQDIIERMRSNSSNPLVLDNYRGIFGAGNIIAPNSSCNSPNSLCNSVQLMARDLYEWEQKLMGTDILDNGSARGGLLNARGCINHVNNRVTVVISWQARTDTTDSATDDAISANCGTAGDSRRQVRVNGFIF